MTYSQTQSIQHFRAFGTPPRHDVYSLLPFYSARFISSFGGLHMVLFHTFGFVVSLDLFMVYKYVALPGCRCVYVRLYV